MGIDVYCTYPNCKFEGKQCFCYRRELLDALRAYLKNNEKNHQVELKYVNWFYREEYDDEDRVTEMSEDERKNARELLREKNLDGLFCWTFLQEEDYISHETAQRFLHTYNIIAPFMKKGCLDCSILSHAAHNKHNLQCW